MAFCSQQLYETVGESLDVGLDELSSLVLNDEPHPMTVSSGIDDDTGLEQVSSGGDSTVDLITDADMQQLSLEIEKERYVSSI